METLYEFKDNYYHVQEHHNFNELGPYYFNKVKDFDDFSYDHKLDYNNRRNVFKFWRAFNTEEEYTKNYGNPFCTIYHRRHIFIVTRNGSKVCLKVFQYERSRNAGYSFFRISTLVNYITYNEDTNCLYVGSIRNYHKKRKFNKRVTKNVFWKDPINKFKGLINSYLYSSKLDTSLITNQIITSFINNIKGTEKYDLLEPSDRLQRLYFEKLGVKLPDNWETFRLTYPQPRKKEFVKNKFKYIDSLMYMHSLNGDKMRRTFHELKHFGGTQVFNWCCAIFGKDFTLQQDIKFLKSLFEQYMHTPNIHREFTKTKKEKLNLFAIFKMTLFGEIDPMTFADHISMYLRLKNFEEVSWNSNTYETFQDEHFTWSEKLGFYTKGDFTRIYSEKFTEEIQTPIVLKDTYYPVLLKTSSQYNTESFVQSNCVKGYIQRAESLIISLRKGDETSRERATIEYRIEKKKNTIMVRRVQTLGRFNQRLTEDWNDSINVLDLKMDSLVSSKVFEIPSLKVKVGNKEVFSESEFVDVFYNTDLDNNLTLDWVNKGINSINSDLLY